MVDEAGKIVWSVVHKSWGLVDRTGVNEIDCQIRFQGQWFDDESGLCYNRFRYYDGEVGQFLCKDPIGLAGGLNEYKYVENPIIKFDRFGLSDEQGYLFRGDNNYRRGESIGQPRSEGVTAESIINHVNESGDGSLTSFSTKKSRGTASDRGAEFFGRAVKVSNADLTELASAGKIRMITPEEARDIISAHPKSKIRRQANDIMANMKRNNEVLIEGEIPADKIKGCS